MEKRNIELTDGSRIILLLDDEYIHVTYSFKCDGELLTRRGDLRDIPNLMEPFTRDMEYEEATSVYILIYDKARDFYCTNCKRGDE